jgi:hypothetical protein
MSNSSSGGSSGIGFFGALGIMFIGLKLAGFIDWPWWLVLSPLWGGVALWLVIVIAIAVGVACEDFNNNQRGWKG